MLFLKCNFFSPIQVLDWLSNHGEVFLRKNIGVGRTLQKARVYQKSHEHFENVVKVSYRCAAISNFRLFFLLGFP